MDNNLKLALKIIGSVTLVVAYTKAVYLFGFIKGGLYVVQEEIAFVGEVLKEDREKRQKFEKDTR